jgi:hypothetical protein
MKTLPRQWTIGCLEGGAKDGGDIFAVTDSKQKISFHEIIQGIEVVEKSEYDKQKYAIDTVLRYCMPHLEYMWAANIVGIILGCDFRDCKQELNKYWKDNSGR